MCTELTSGTPCGEKNIPDVVYNSLFAVLSECPSLKVSIWHLFTCLSVALSLLCTTNLHILMIKKKKLLTHTLFSNLPWPSSAKESITIIQTLPFTSALRIRPAHRGSLLDCRQHFILWTPARQKPFRPINRHRRLASPLCSLSLSFPPSLGDHSIKTVLFCQRSIVIRH